MEIFNVNSLEAPVRLDWWLKSSCHLNYGLIQKLLRKSDIKLNSKRVSGAQKVFNGDVVAVYAQLKEIAQQAVRKVDQKLYAELLEQVKKNIIFKDESVVVINKPYDIATQGGSGIKISIDDILDGLKFESEIRPRLVHRLDKCTTGALLLARTKQVAGLITGLFKNGLIEKKYLAVLAGLLSTKAGTIRSEVAKLGSEDLKEAITKYKVISSNPEQGTSFVEFTPITGRTHQLRIHAAKELQCPIVGDTKYGGVAALAPDLVKKVHLHASEIKIKDLLGKSYALKAEMPAHMEEVVCLTDFKN